MIIETLSNVVFHRVYDERGPIEVRVENDRITIKLRGNQHAASRLRPSAR